MQGKNCAKAAGFFFAGLAVGFLYARHVGIDCCCGPEGENCGGDKPPLHVKPVPITKKSKEGPCAESSPQEDTE